MDDSQFADVSTLLVTADNPARGDFLGLDHRRCVALHNYLVRYAWTAEGGSLASLNGNNKTFFTTYGAAAEALRERLDPSLAAFLHAALLPPDGLDDLDPAPFFYFVAGFCEPGEFFAREAADLFDEPVDSLICLYYPNIGQGGEGGGGLLYHQGYHLAAVLMHMDDYDYVLPVEAHRELWHPLETVLSNWIQLIHLGKAQVTASPRDTPGLYGSEKIGPWEWRPYSEAQVAACIDAWDRLCEAIETRISLVSGSNNNSTAATNAVNPEPLLDPEILDAASLPNPCFARSFLTHARRPLFHSIAPGLVLPPSDAAGFVAVQPFTGLPRAHHTIPPVCLFPAAEGEPEVVLTLSSNPFCNDFRATTADSPVPSRVGAGVYSQSVDRDACHDYAEEGFWLLLPYSFKSDWDAAEGARKSDGSLIARDRLADLFQHGYKPFGGDYYRPQRLERLFDCWCKLVDQGIWSVGPQGVQGAIDTFTEAGTARWKDYLISPTW
ncbi:uncharacterized protein TRIVIDRAFT_225614 [Trichoderma virens Gv29-8]|uniref:Uncharacterized protein n=1 Tax=Hypocrea virens (strain Gv29-8 / FGSC 10586) TaxID=413071 RepID=G9N3X1_HYPVG|nr:uncharacterized protein TRIVIDRAFT_225614 [Trichoderma virens Gv29-8]EHK18300.1 hypothetical protein TRIVIDRAFT_225614 [Trichoderma virens Gv29-8]UKZ52514.1 hypothetical protein TrVGV298_006291 [Trichoderma virens]